MLCHKQLVGKLLVVWSGVILVENHEFDSELKGEPAEAVSVGKDHFLNTSSVDPFQKGNKLFAGAVGNLLDEFALSLLVGRDSSVDDFRFRLDVGNVVEPADDASVCPSAQSCIGNGVLPLDGTSRNIAGLRTRTFEPDRGRVGKSKRDCLSRPRE
jgi:hypothetical protein